MGVTMKFDLGEVRRFVLYGCQNEHYQVDDENIIGYYDIFGDAVAAGQLQSQYQFQVLVDRHTLAYWISEDFGQTQLDFGHKPLNIEIVNEF